MSILKDIQEGNAANKIAKNLHAVKVGHGKSMHALLDKTKSHDRAMTGATYNSLVQAQSGSSKSYHLNKTADKMKRDGRAVLKTGQMAKEEVEQVDEVSISTVSSYKKKALYDLTDKKGAVKPNRVAGLKNAQKRETAHMVKTKGPQSFPDAHDGRGLDLPKKTVQKSSVEKVTKSPMREAIEALIEKEGDPYKKRGRPRKPRHEDGKIVNEDA